MEKIDVMIVIVITKSICSFVFIFLMGTKIFDIPGFLQQLVCTIDYMMPSIWWSRLSIKVIFIFTTTYGRFFAW